MTQEHPITPPSEGFVLQWSDEWYKAKVKHMNREQHLCMQAARWGADQELERCCEWVSQFNYDDYSYGDRLRAVRRCRPAPSSLREQALTILDDASDRLNAVQENILRRALESLPD